MGRLSFLRRTVPLILAQPALNLCLVDYSCPDRCGDWLESTFAEAIRQRRAVVERVRGQTRFHKCRAHNAGARRARRQGAEYLCFLDADTLVEAGFADFVVERLHPQRFLIAGLRADGSDMPSMTGLLVVHGAAFDRVGGFDDGFQGWGGEDIELRLRLFLLGGLRYADVPLSLVQPIPHEDSLRTRFYAQPDIYDSNRRNMARVQEKIASEWAPHLKQPLEAAARLYYHAGRRQSEALPWGTLARRQGSAGGTPDPAEHRPSGYGLQGLVRRVVDSRLASGRHGRAR